MVLTRQKNKHTHPGYVDRGDSAQGSQVSRHAAAEKSRTQPTSEERELVIQQVAAAEDQLLASQKQKIASARQPSGPGMAKKPRTVTKPALPSVSTETNGTVGTYMLHAC